MFHQDKVRSDTSLVTRQKLLKINSEVMLCSLHNPNLHPLDYYLFRSLQNSLNAKT